MISPNLRGRATPLCYPSSERNGSMKVRWGNGLRSIFLLALPLGAVWSHAKSPGEAPPPVARAQAPDRSTQAEAAVVAVRIVSEDGRVLSESPGGLPIQIDKPLDREQVADSLRILYRTGNYADL